MHNPCGILNPSSIRILDGGCSKRFLKRYVDEDHCDNLLLYTTYKRWSLENEGERVPWTYRQAKFSPQR